MTSKNCSDHIPTDYTFFKYTCKHLRWSHSRRLNDESRGTARALWTYFEFVVINHSEHCLTLRTEDHESGIFLHLLSVHAIFYQHKNLGPEFFY